MLHLLHHIHNYTHIHIQPGFCILSTYMSHLQTTLHCNSADLYTKVLFCFFLPVNPQSASRSSAVINAPLEQSVWTFYEHLQRKARLRINRFDFALISCWTQLGKPSKRGRKSPKCSRNLFQEDAKSCFLALVAFFYRYSLVFSFYKWRAL